jgi:hypothetical protein
MQDFDSLKNMWQQSSAEDSPLQTLSISKTSTNEKMKMQKQQLGGSIMLLITSLLIGIMAIFGNLNFNRWYTYAGMALICLVCVCQAAFMFAIYKKLKKIDDTVTPGLHLQQWENYYMMRKNQNKWNMPLYYLLLNIAMGIYVLEIFTGRPVISVIIFISVYAAWMLFAYFYLGKRNIKKETARLNGILSELKAIETQLNKHG